MLLRQGDAMAKTKLKTVYKVKWKNLGVLVLCLVCISILVLAIYEVTLYFKDKHSTNLVIDEINEKIKISSIVDDDATKTIAPDSKLSKFDSYWDYIKLGLVDVDMATLKKINSSAVGYIEVKGTNFSYPIVEYADGIYKNHTFNKKENSFGWIYLSSDSTLESLGTNTVVLGNKNYSKLLMSSLNKVFKSDWQEDDENFIIKYSTNYYSTLFQIMSVYETDTNEHLKTSFENEEELQKFISDSIEKSSFRFKTDAKVTDKFLTLSTNAKKKNMVVLAKLIKIRGN